MSERTASTVIISGVGSGVCSGSGSGVGIGVGAGVEIGVGSAITGSDGASGTWHALALSNKKNTRKASIIRSFRILWSLWVFGTFCVLFIVDILANN